MALGDATALQTVRTQIIARITELTASLNPDVSDQGRSVQLAGLLRTLTDQLKAVEEEIQAAEGPWLVTSRGRAV